jgi:hypothetical protein
MSTLPSLPSQTYPWKTVLGSTAIMPGSVETLLHYLDEIGLKSCSEVRAGCQMIAQSPALQSVLNFPIIQ